ncbi:MAG: hypothetical protein H6Q57_1433 [Geobacteraceae bacterium]|nr:hypothetical protein [Geobacteraceae bacterium]
MKILVIVSCFVAAVFSICVSVEAGAETADNHAHKTSQARQNPDGTIEFGGEFKFQPPPPPWEFIQGGDAGGFAFGFYRKDPGTSRLESTFFAYDEEPYGYSRNPEERAGEFLKRFFWASHVKVAVIERKKMPVLGGEGFVVVMEGKDPVKKTKVRSKVIFGKRGERVVAFYINQWRTDDGTYDLSAFDAFDRFANSLRFLRKSFYEAL